MVGLLSLGYQLYADGASGAPAGPAQLPTLLAGYAVRPPWNVAGVDYATGIPSGTVLLDPFTSFPGTIAPALVTAGATFNSGNNVLTFSNQNGHTADNAVIDSYDFGLHGGVTVQPIANGMTIQNCNFKIGANARIPILVDAACNGITITKNSFDSNSIDNSTLAGQIGVNAYNTVTVTYNYFKNPYREAIVMGGSPNGAVSATIQYNLIQNAGFGFQFNNLIHADWIQSVVENADTWNFLNWNFNTCVQTLNDATARTQGLSLFSAAGQSVLGATGFCVNEQVQNNTIVVSGTGGNAVNVGIILNTTWLQNSGTVINNYVDPTGINGQNWLENGTNNGAIIMGHISGTTLTVDSFISGNGTSIVPGSTTRVAGNGVTTGTLVNSGSNPTFTLNNSMSIASEKMVVGDGLQFNAVTTVSGNINMTNGATLT